jgi:hypothetical protein
VIKKVLKSLIKMLGYDIYRVRRVSSSPAIELQPIGLNSSNQGNYSPRIEL